MAIITSCSHDDTKDELQSMSEKDIIPVNKMSQILIDIHLAEAAITIKQLQNQDAIYYSKLYYTSILKKHGTNTADIRGSLAYYLEHPATFQIIYSEVMANIAESQSIMISENNQTMNLSGFRMRERLMNAGIDSL